MRLEYKGECKWDERVQWSLHHLFYHVFAVHAMHKTLEEGQVDQFKEWIESSVDESLQIVARQLVSDAFMQVMMMSSMAKDPADVNYKIDPAYPMKWKSLPNNLRYNDYFDMNTFFNLTCVKEVQRYVKKANVQASNRVRGVVRE